MTAKSTAFAKRRRGWAVAALAAAWAAALAGACSTSQVEDFAHAAGKIAYDSMKAREHHQ